MINEEVKKDSLVRLKKIEGQIRGIARMVENEKYCIDIINQITAAEKALNVVSKNVMKRHVESCVKEAILKGEGQAKINELIETVYKYSKK
ncbi:MAG: metal-sensitive transcriptional regulator [Desulfobacteraceae bacterium]|nr:metal-sensitive transcriptional regulator [Desulfobacteraceae bacterium]